MTVASVYSVGGRLEVYASGASGGSYTPLRIVSYDDGNSWVDHWTQPSQAPFTSMIAGAITGDTLDTVLVGRQPDNRFAACRLSEYFNLPAGGWAPIGAGVFTGKPAVCLSGVSQTEPAQSGPVTSYSAVRVSVFGRGTDNRIWWAYSNDGAASWAMAWGPIGTGLFTSAPAAVCSAAGEVLAVFGVGTDRRMWWAFSTSSGSSWDMAWAPIGEGLFTSDPAAACSADGSRIYVFGRGDDNRCWWASTARGTAGWDMAWAPIGEGLFTSALAAGCSWDGQIIQVLGRGTDDRIWQARSQNYGGSWDIAWRAISNQQFAGG